MPERLERFMHVMSGVSAGNFRPFARRFDFSRYGTLCDVGGAPGQLSCMVAKGNPHMRCADFDLRKVTPIARRRIDGADLSDRVSAMDGDFFADALPEGGVFVVIDAWIDGAHRENAFGLPVSLDMLIELGDAFDDTAADFFGWCAETDFRKVEVMLLTGRSDPQATGRKVTDSFAIKN